MKTVKKSINSDEGADKLKRNLIKTQNILRRKFLKLKKSRMEANKILEKNFKPLIDPLNAIAENMKRPSSSAFKIEKSEEKEEQMEKEEEDKPQKDNDVFDLGFDQGKNVEIIKWGKPPPPRYSSNPAFIRTETVAETPSPRLSMELMQQHYDTPDTRDEINISLNQFESLPKKYLKMLVSDTIGVTDTTYGIRFNPDTQGWMIGDSAVEIDGHDILIGDRKYLGTNGLYQLLFMKNPEDYTDEDLLRYGTILRQTNAHKRGYKADGQINGNKSNKYRTIIKKLFPVDVRTRFFSVPGSGLRVTTSNPRYVYWNSINELVDRLRLLYAEKSAGNNSTDSEISSILEELKEEGIIY